MFIVDIHYTADLSIIDQHLAEHRNYLDTQYQLGNLLCSGPKTPRTGGTVIALFNTHEEVDNFVKNDPFYKHQVAKYTITEFTPVKYHQAIKDICV